MRAPRFWNRPADQAGLWPILLAPAAAIWRGVTARRLAKGPRQKLSVPVVCIGNINIGGTGKTPATIALQSQLLETGINAHVVSRGYGGKASGPLRVDERLHSATQVGDEPLLMAAFGPVWVAKDRTAGTESAIKDGAQIILLDDGFQNPALHHDLSIVVIDAKTGFGNGRVIPAGPLREPLKSGLARAD
ncbi:MAG: tetraacyldisaccharide 4'-kinase, partial [Rhodobacteraceae bacterium]|nr:tetraacyldisaccharide 4'-kinase [Paracoccaceae bacterium]